MRPAASSSDVISGAEGANGPSRFWPHSGAWIAFLIFVIYALVPTREFYWDGVGFALNIETQPISFSHLLNPNHLVYNLMGYAFWRILAASGIAVRALFVLQAVNAAFAAAGVYVFWHIVKVLSGSARRAACCALLFAFSATWWRFATDADAYIPSVFFLMLCFYFLLPSREPRPCMIGLAHSAAMLFHQLALFFFPVALYGLLLSPTGPKDVQDRRRRRLYAAQYALTAFLATAGAYVMSYRAVRPGIGPMKFFSWLTVHAGDASFTFNAMRNLNLTLRGTLRLFLGGRVTLVKPGFVTGAGVLAGCAILVLLVRYFARAKRAAAPHPPTPSPARLKDWLVANRLPLVWISSYMAFLFFWLPQNTFYRLFYLPALILLLARAPIWHADRIRLIALLTAAACMWNFTVSIYPRSRTETNEVLAFALTHRDEWQPGTLIVYRTFHTDLWTISYFNPQVQWIALSTAGVDQAERYRREAAEKRQGFWLDGTAYDAIAGAGGRAWLDSHVDRIRSFVFASASHTIRFYRVD